MEGVAQPSGIVTLVFTDVEGSTRLLGELGEDRYLAALREHREVVREAFGRYGGYEVDTQGDSFFYAFAAAPEAVSAIGEAMAALEGGPIAIRVGVHTGEPGLDGRNYVGLVVHKAARIMSAGHGGQVLVSTSTRRLVEADFRALGEHRLKDFPEPIELFQLGDARFPPLRTISNTNLPRPVSSFVGRDRELAEVTGLVGNQGARLVTLVGPGGTGKTRLAIEVAAELVADFAAGVFWVALAPVRDPAQVMSTIAQTLGAKQSLAEHIGERELLLVLDNFEQLVDAAPELAALLLACPKLRLLVTSRELLGIAGEIPYAVPTLSDREAVELFRTRAQVEESDTVAELCRRLDNLPLAVELAAARTSVLSPEQILGRIAQRLDLFHGGRDTDLRQRTLRATIEWSFDLLSPREQTQFSRLSVFVGGFTLEAGADVCDATLDELESLVVKSLLRHTGERFWTLETLREFAAEKLEASGAMDELRRRHARYFLELFESREDAMRARLETQSDYVALVASEQGNGRYALAWFRESSDPVELARFVAALYPLWIATPSEGRAILDAALAETDIPDEVRGRVLFAAALVARVQVDTSSQTRYLEELILVSERLGDRRLYALALLSLAIAAFIERNYDLGRARLRDSGRIAAEFGDQYHLAIAANLEAHIPLYQGQPELAERLFEEALRLAREAEWPELEKRVLHNLGLAVLEQERIDDAASLFRESIAIPDLVATSEGAVEGLAAVAIARDDPGKAARLLGAIEAWRSETGRRNDPFEKELAERTAGAARKMLGEGAYRELAAAGAKLELYEAVELALTV
jgi:predicted ATPase/Tfp pilus assembly protein PilF